MCSFACPPGPQKRGVKVEARLSADQGEDKNCTWVWKDGQPHCNRMWRYETSSGSEAREVVQIAACPARKSCPIDLANDSPSQWISLRTPSAAPGQQSASGLGRPVACELYPYQHTFRTFESFGTSYIYFCTSENHGGSIPSPVIGS